MTKDVQAELQNSEFQAWFSYNPPAPVDPDAPTYIEGLPEAYKSLSDWGVPEDIARLYFQNAREIIFAEMEVRNRTSLNELENLREY